MGKYKLFLQYVNSSRLRFIIITGSMWGILTATLFNIFMGYLSDIHIAFFSYLAFIVGGLGFGNILYYLVQKINRKNEKSKST